MENSVILKSSNFSRLTGPSVLAYAKRKTHAWGGSFIKKKLVQFEIEQFTFCRPL